MLITFYFIFAVQSFLVKEQKDVVGHVTLQYDFYGRPAFEPVSGRYLYYHFGYANNPNRQHARNIFEILALSSHPADNRFVELLRYE